MFVSFTLLGQAAASMGLAFIRKGHSLILVGRCLRSGTDGRINCGAAHVVALWQTVLQFDGFQLCVETSIQMATLSLFQSLTCAVLKEQLHVGRLQLALVLEVEVAAAIGRAHRLSARATLRLIVHILKLKVTQLLLARLPSIALAQHLVILGISVLCIVVAPVELSWQSCSSRCNSCGCHSQQIQ